MTVSTTTNRAAYTGNGVTTVFAFPYKFIAAADLVIYIAGVLQASGFSVGVPTDSGANVTFSAAPAVGAAIVILANPAQLQSTSLPSTGPFPAKAVETALDKLTLLIQRVSELATRSFRLSDSDTSGASTILPSPRSNALIGWDATASGLQNVDPITLATIVAFGTANADVFTGTGAQTAFTLSANPGAQANLDVAVGGVTQLPGIDYIWSGGTTVTFTTAPPNGVKVLLRYFQGLPQGVTDSASATFTQSGTGAVPRNVRDKLREIVSVKDFGAIGDGVTNDLAAFQIAAAALASGMELHFPPGRYKLAWAGAKPTKSTIAFDLFQLSNIKLIGHGATIVITNHDVGLYGGLLFCRPRACKNMEISGFNVEMSFIGSNISAACYPESGFVYGHNTNENAVSWPVPVVDRLENITVSNNTFSIQSQFGAYSTSPNPYLGDANNGGKAYSIFLRGEQAEATYDGQNKGITIQNNTWSDQHQAYGIWVWGFSDVEIAGNKFHGYAVRTANYLNATLGGSVPAIRCHKFFTRNWNIHHNTIQGRVPANRTGAFDGSSAFISFQQEATAYDPESVVSINSNILDIGSNSGALADIGIQILCGGNFDILGNTFACSSTILSATGIQLGDVTSYASNISQYINIGGSNTFARSFNKGVPIVYTSASSVAPGQRTLKSLTVKDNAFNGYYRNVLQRNVLGATYEGPLYQIVDGNAVNGFDNTSAPPSDVNNIPFDIYVEQASDLAIVKNNGIRSCYTGIRGTGASIANASAINNKVISAVNRPITGIVNLSPNSQPTVTAFLSAANVVVQGSAIKNYGTIGLALDPTGLVKDKFSGTFAGGTLLVAAPTGFTWELFQWEVGDAP